MIPAHIQYHFHLQLESNIHQFEMQIEEIWCCLLLFSVYVNNKIHSNKCTFYKSIFCAVTVRLFF